MAIFFPARKESSPSRTRGAPKVDSGDVQNFAPPQNRGTRSVPGAFGEEGAKPTPKPIDTRPKYGPGY